MTILYYGLFIFTPCLTTFKIIISVHSWLLINSSFCITLFVSGGCKSSEELGINVKKWSCASVWIHESFLFQSFGAYLFWQRSHWSRDSWFKTAIWHCKCLFLKQKVDNSFHFFLSTLILIAQFDCWPICLFFTTLTLLVSSGLQRIRERFTQCWSSASERGDGQR